MDSEMEPKESKRLRLSTDQEPENMDLDSESKSETTHATSVGTTIEPSNAKPAEDDKQKMTEDDKGDEVVVISSDDDSEKATCTESMETKTEEKRPEEEQDEGQSKVSEDKPVEAEDKVTMKEEHTREETAEVPETKTESAKVLSIDKAASETKPPAKADSDSDDCISQEDLLAQLGLSSVRAKRSRKDERLPNGVPSQRPLLQHKPKESIVDLLRAPRLKATEPPKKKINGDAAVVISNGVNSDESSPGTPEMIDGEVNEDDDELTAKEQLIEELRQELRNEEAKLMLLKKLQAAQNDTSKSGSKYLKEKENEKMLSSMQFATKPSSQLSSKKGQGLPPPPPLKTHVTTAGTYQPPVAIQPKLLPKVGGQQLHTSASLMSSKPTSSVQVLKGTTTSTRSGTSAIKDLQNVISSMSTNLIHPTPLYLRTTTQPAAVYSTTTQASPVRPTPVRANTSTGASSSSGYSSFPPHGSVAAAKPSTHVTVLSTAGKQAAAKMALRKQLEKTLLQIPPPKPPPPEWSFIPSLNSTEFMTLVGFEMVVDVLANKKEPKSALTQKPSVSENPKVCGQCGTDFTPGWKKKPNTSSGVIMCEKCSTVNVKKELKAEHTTRLKAAFLKALKQEQEIEQKMSDSTPIAPKPQSSKTSHSSSSSGHQHHHISHPQGVIHHHHQRVQPSIYHHHGQQHTDSLLFQLQQQHLQQQQQEMEVACRQADIRWHPYLNTQHHRSSHKPQHHHSYVSDSDRQYLLDMIPSLPAQSLGYSSSRI